MVTVLLALCAAFAFGASIALQQRDAARIPYAYALRSALLARLMRQPVWLAGLAASGTGLVLQTLALRKGALVVVQPVMTATLAFAFAFIALTRRARPHLSECAAVAAVLTGLGIFLALAAPRGESTADARSAAWWALGAAVAAVTCIAAVISLRHVGANRAACLGLAAGVSNGFVAVLTKTVAGELHHGTRLLLNWPLWALAVAGVPAVLLVQTAYQAGHLRVSLPIIAVVEPVLACAVGLALFHEHVSVDGARTFGILAATLLCGAGLVRLAHNPWISADRRPHSTGLARRRTYARLGMTFARLRILYDRRLPHSTTQLDHLVIADPGQLPRQRLRHDPASGHHSGAAASDASSRKR